MDSTNSIFEDLEINVGGFLQADNVDDFATAVMEAAKKLEDIMDTDTSVSKLERQVKDEWHKAPILREELDKYFKSASTKLYEDGEHLDLAILYGLIQDLRRLANDLENTMHDRMKKEVAASSSPLYDKKLAQMRHKSLREAWDSYRQVVKSFYGKNLPSIKARPGNYQATITDTLMYRFEDGSEFYNPRAVAKKLGIWFEGFRFADLMDHIEKNPDCVEVIKVEL